MAWETGHRDARRPSIICSTRLLRAVMIVLLLCLRAGKCAAQEVAETAFCQSFVRPSGRSCEEHKMYSSDGFALLLHRIGAAPSGMGNPDANEASAAYEQQQQANPSGVKMGMKLGVPGAVSRQARPDPPEDLATLANNFLIDWERPYQTAGEGDPPVAEEGSSRWEGFNAHGSPENRPWGLPPLDLEDDFTSGEPRMGSPAGAPVPPPMPVIPGPLPFPADQISIPAQPPSPPFPQTSPPVGTPAVGVQEAPGPTTFPQTFSPVETPSQGSAPPTIAPSQNVALGDAVLLMHPELLNGDSWFKEVGQKGDSRFLPMILADEGFDVWISHERATYWAHDHTYLDSSSQEYWNWTWDDHAQRDVPTMLGYINAKVNRKIHVVGVSQSATVGAAAATRQEVARFMKSLVLIGPTIYRGAGTPPLLIMLTSVFTRTFDWTRPNFSPVPGPFNITRDFEMSSFTLGGPGSVISGPDCCINSFVTLFGNGWDGTTSNKNIMQFMQGLLRDTFQRFDYTSPQLNLEAYGQPTPPAYSAWDIPKDLPVQVIHAGQDYFSPPDGIRKLFSAMQRAPASVYLPLYAHFDLFFSSTRNEDVFQPLLSFLRDLKSAAG